MPNEDRVDVEIEGRTLSLSNLDKVMYPGIGFTKAEVIDYYVKIAPIMLNHIGDRGITLIRYPDGVEGESFFSKRCVDYRPPWIDAVPGPGRSDGASLNYCQLAEPAALAWTANLAALELHAPMARSIDIERPTTVVFDLDPGPGCGLVDCATVALEIRELLTHLDLRSFPKTSGGAGLHLYVPINDGADVDHGTASQFAHAIAELVAKHHPDRVVTSMSRALRQGKVFIDWSQNSRHKTTVAPYSMRATPHATVSTPLSWEEVTAGAEGEPLRFVTGDVLGRVDRLGDLFAEVVTLAQFLPALDTRAPD